MTGDSEWVKMTKKYSKYDSDYNFLTKWIFLKVKITEFLIDLHVRFLRKKSFFLSY